MKNIGTIDFYDFNLEKGKQQDHIILSYELFGAPLGTAPVVVVNHSLNAASRLGFEKSRLSNLIGKTKAIDTDNYTIICFNVPGSGFDNKEKSLIKNYKDFTIRDVANLFWEGLFLLKVNNVFAIVGGNLGGAIGWEMTALEPNRVENFIPIASDWKVTDRTITNVYIQDQLLNNSEDPWTDARYFANLRFRNSEFINKIFTRKNLVTTSIFNIEKIVAQKNKYQISGCRLMNFILSTNDLTRNREDILSIASKINANIHIIGIDADGIFPANENRDTFQKIRAVKTNVFYHEIESEFGQDAYLFETEKIASILKPIFTPNNFLIKNRFNYKSTTGKYLFGS